MKGPLLARLKFYGFAMVQTDPRRPIDPSEWGVPGLQALVRGTFWSALCRNCQPFSWQSLQPVLASSFAALLRIRKTQPRRPLIFCQTAYEAKPRQNRWQKLIIRRPLPFLARDDPGLPLLWVGPPDPKVKTRLLAYPKKHPLDTKLNQLQKNYPQHHFWLEENGALATQFCLFDERRPMIDSWFDEPTKEWSFSLKQETQDLQGPWVVVAETKRSLRMFEHDLIRLWGPRFNFLQGVIPEPGDVAGRVFVPLSDKEMRWGTNALCGWPILHLGGNRRQQAYRHVRVSSPKKPGWVAFERVHGEALWSGHGRSWRFQRTSQGWHLPLVAHELPRLDQCFEDTAACFAS